MSTFNSAMATYSKALDAMYAARRYTGRDGRYGDHEALERSAEEARMAAEAAMRNTPAEAGPANPWPDDGDDC